MAYLLDTCIFIDLMKGSPAVQDRIAEAGLNNCFCCDIVLAELYVGPLKTRSTLHLKQADWIAQKFPALSFRESYKTYARIRAFQENQGTRLDNMDMLIASIALDHDLTMITRNRKHFERIPGLQVEDWFTE